MDDGDEHIERTGGGRGHYTCASIQSHRVISVPVPALAADAVVDGGIDLSVQLKSEDIGRWEWIAPLPLVAPERAPFHRALGEGHTEKGKKRKERQRQGR